MAKEKLPKATSLNQVYNWCIQGNEDWQRVVIGTLSNLGNPTLRKRPGQPLWKDAWEGLQQYIDALCMEYGDTEEDAERGILGEINFIRNQCWDVSLTKPSN